MKVTETLDEMRARWGVMTQDSYEQVDRIRLGQNFVRRGDVVKIAPSRKHARDGFKAATVTALFLVAGLDPDESIDPRDVETERVSREVAQVRVADPKTGASRTFFIDRVRRRSQTKARA